MQERGSLDLVYSTNYSYPNRVHFGSS